MRCSGKGLNGTITNMIIMDTLLIFYTDDDSDGLFYTSQDLEYIYFVHSLCLLGRVLLYSGGRALFPVILPDTDGRIHYIILLFIGKIAKQRVLN